MVVKLCAYVGEIQISPIKRKIQEDLKKDYSFEYILKVSIRKG